MRSSLIHSAVGTLLFLVGLLLLGEIPVRSQAVEQEEQQFQASRKMTEQELANLFKRARERREEQAREKEILKELEGFNDEEGHAARERLAQEKRKIEEAERRAAEAMEKWNALSPDEQARVIKLAQERANKRQQDIVKDIELSEKLKTKEGAELEAQLDEKLRKEEEKEMQAASVKYEADRIEFNKKREAHKSQQLLERNTPKAILFWLGTFTLSVVISRALVSIQSS